MSEYWKSTPRYWCKHCKIYIRDTKFEKQQHEATGKHQGNLNRFLRELHRGNDRAEREKQRAKDEVERLNGIVSGTGLSSTASSSKSVPTGKREPAPRQATVEDRKQQLAQLASMGVAIPDEFRREMAMAGDWQTVSWAPAKKRDEDEKDPNIKKSIGVHKRKIPEEEEEEEADERAGAKPGVTATRKKWGTTIKTYPGSTQDDEDLDALLEKSKQAKATKSSEERITQEQDRGPEKNDETVIKQDPDATQTDGTDGREALAPSDAVPVKKEEPDADTDTDTGIPSSVKDIADTADAPVKSEEDAAPGAGVVFKKRSAKKIRQK